ncbi:amidohydrolase family protein [Clostridium sp. AL.422]|uniref:amidohydrolase family protein n=1 Tax=Clostridium TaxID=1485 RepID=UPI00293DAB3A|nr:MULTISPECIES: amidohydrolase family protein [unclassified Clostridium]MDV4152612.1 amidohydrolase family protein [Clostridium sp. AL.422]
MKNSYIVKSKKIVTVSKLMTLLEGAFVVEGDVIKDIGYFKDITSKYKDLNVVDFGELVISPSLVDCHTHLLEYAPSTVYPVTDITYEMAQQALVLKGIMSGITAFGEQICGSPMYEISINEYKEKVKNMPADIVFSANSITIGFEELVNLTAVTGKKAVDKETLVNNEVIEKLAKYSDYPGENIFINATPANLTSNLVPRAGEIIYTQDEIDKIVDIFHRNGKKIGCHVAGKEGINMAINSKMDIIHHGHGIDDELINKVKKSNIIIVATPLGGTHLTPNSPEEIAKLVQEGIVVTISTDAYLPPDNTLPWLNFKDEFPKGPEALIALANPTMEMLKNIGIDENYILALITLNGAKVLGMEESIGSIEIGKKANFLASKGVPGLEITDIEDILKVYYKGKCIINREI